MDFVYFPPNPDFTFLLVNPLLKVLARVVFFLVKSHTVSTKNVQEQAKVLK